MNAWLILSQTLALVALFALSFFFSGSETILFSLTGIQRRRIRERDAAADARIGICLGDSALLLSTLLVGNTIVNFAIATIGYRLMAKAMPGCGIIAVPVMTAALLVFGEITPKQIALRYTERLAPPCARLMLFWRTVLAPCNAFLKFVSRAFAPGLERERRALSDGELVSVLEAAAERGEFAAVDVAMIDGVLRLSELCASDEMTPRVDMEVYDLDLPESERAQKAAAARHRYLPAIRRTPDAVEGIYDRVTGRVEDALFVPESNTLDDLLVIFRRSGKPVAVVLDEYGGTAGMIGLNDILELVFGPQVFADADSEPMIVRKQPNVWLIDGRVNLEEVNHELGVELDADNADRLSGWVAYHAERIPHVGQHIVADGCRATVLKRRRRRVTLVELEVIDRMEPVSDAMIMAETDEEVERTEETA